jgi:predicted phosphodiesterase
MNFRNLLPVFLCAGALSAQTFIQMSDPQFGMYSKDVDFAHETANFEFAIATANRLKPAFVVITGDLTNKSSDAAQTAEYKRISSRLNPAIKLYRERYGADYYAFRSGDIYGIVLNSNLEKGAEKVPEEAAKMETWFHAELDKAKQSGAKHVIVFQHISFFLKEPNEPDQYFNVPLPVRARYLKLMHEYGVRQVFAGHYHRNEEGRDGDLDMVTTGPVGMPLEGGKSGIRIVSVAAGTITHKYHDFGDLP